MSDRPRRVEVRHQGERELESRTRTYFRIDGPEVLSVPKNRSKEASAVVS